MIPSREYFFFYSANYVVMDFFYRWGQKKNKLKVISGVIWGFILFFTFYSRIRVYAKITLLLLILA